jgi:hypothetical protein
MPLREIEEMQVEPNKHKQLGQRDNAPAQKGEYGAKKRRGTAADTKTHVL